MKRLLIYIITACFIGYGIAVGPAAYALRVAVNVDVHQNKFPDFANDFHIWGIVESGDHQGNNPPILVDHADDLFPNFNSVIGGAPTRPLPPGAPPILNPPFYFFEGSWSGANIPSCNWVHLGLEFDETCHNIGYWLQGVWTKDGVDPSGNPLYGFKVDDLGPQQTFTIQNASDVQTELLQMDLAVLAPGTDFPLQNLNADYFANNPDAVNWFTVDVSGGGGSGGTIMTGDGSEFEVDIESVLGRRLDFSEILISRQHSSYEGASTDYFWQFEMHEAHPIPEPTTICLMGFGILGLLGIVIRRHRKNK
jgi:hypothetical protein